MAKGYRKALNARLMTELTPALNAPDPQERMRWMRINALQNEINDLRAKLFDIDASFDAAGNATGQFGGATAQRHANWLIPTIVTGTRVLKAEFDFDSAEKILNRL